MKILTADKPEDIDKWPSAEEVFRPILEDMKKKEKEKWKKKNQKSNC